MLARLPAFAARADHQTARRTGPRRPRAGVGTGHVRFNYLREVGVPACSHPGGTPGANGSGPSRFCLPHFGHGADHTCARAARRPAGRTRRAVEWAAGQPN